MTARESIACLAAAVSMGLAGYFAHRLSGSDAELERLRNGAFRKAAEARKEESRLALARKEAARLQEELSAARKSEADAKALLASMERPPESAPPPPVAAAKKRSRLAEMMAMNAKMMESPATRANMRTAIGPFVSQLYADFLGGCGLDPEARKAAEEAIVNRMMDQMAVNLLMFDPEVAAEEVLRRVEESRAKSDEALAKVLPPERVAELAEYEKGIPDRMRTQRTEASLAGLDLEPARAAQVRPVLLECQREAEQLAEEGFGGFQRTHMNGMSGPVTLESIRRTRAVLSGESSLPDAAGILSKMRAQRAATAERLRPYLTEEQLVAFRRQQEAELQTMEMGLKMLGGGGNE